MSRRHIMVVTIAALCAASRACANPVVGPDFHMSVIWWFLKTLPFNYSADLIALSVGLLITRQMEGPSWRLIPFYNIPVVIMGYLADGAALGLNGYSLFGLSPDDVMGKLVQDYGTFGYPRTMDDAAAVLALGTLFIFAANLLTVSCILRLNDAASYRRVPLAAAAIAVLTAPYLAVSNTVWPARIVPALAVLAGAGLWWSATVLLRTARRPREAQGNPAGRRDGL